MKPDRYVSYKCGDIVRLLPPGVTMPNEKVVLITNCKCVLPHHTPELYAATHEDGCLMAPFEGIVFQMGANRKVLGWHMQDITGWLPIANEFELAGTVKEQMQAMLDAAYKKKRN